MKRVEIKSKEIVEVSPDELCPHPKNMHTHSDEQINKLISLIEYQGFRTPIIAQAGTNLIVAGHGRLMAAKKMGMDKVPVAYQEFDSEAQLYAFMVSDNAIGKDTWATLDLSKIEGDIKEIPDFDIDMLGIKDFEITPVESELPDLGDGKDPDIQQVSFILSNEQKDFLDDAMGKAKKELDCTDEINENKNGNILAAILKNYVS